MIDMKKIAHKAKVVSANSNSSFNVGDIVTFLGKKATGKRWTSAIQGCTFQVIGQTSV